MSERHFTESELARAEGVLGQYFKLMEGRAVNAGEFKAWLRDTIAKIAEALTSDWPEQPRLNTKIMFDAPHQLEVINRLHELGVLDQIAQEFGYPIAVVLDGREGRILLVQGRQRRTRVPEPARRPG